MSVSHAITFFMLNGRYDDEYIKKASRNAPKYTDAEMKIISSPVDFVGINIYIPSIAVKASDHPSGYEEVPFSFYHPKMFWEWHRLDPESQYWSPRLLHEIWKQKKSVSPRTVAPLPMNWQRMLKSTTTA